MEKLFGSWHFRYIADIAPEKDTSGVIIRVFPQNNYDNRANYPLHEHGKGPFCKFRIPRNIKEKGVYVITVNDEPYYVGECENLSQRYNMGYGQISPRNCFKGGQSTNCRVNNLILLEIQQNNLVQLWFHQTDEYKQIEAELIQLLDMREKWNRKS